MDAHLRALIDRAQALGVVVEEGVGPGWVRLHHGMRSQLVRDGTLFESLRATADAICSQKDDCKRFLAEASIPVPEGVVVPVPGWDHEVVADLLRRCPTLVAKPVDGTDGLGVALGLKGLAEIEAYLESALGTHILLEEQIEGEDLRLQAIGGRFVCGCIRRPAEVVGDGRSSIRGLISNRNRELGALNPANRIDVDAAVESLLHAQGTTLDSVADDGSAVRLKTVANISQGGRAVDCSDRVHPRYLEWIEAIAEALEIRVFSLDAIALDPSIDPIQGAHVLELNSRPAWLHHTFSEGRTHDIPGLLLDDLFPGLL